MSQTQDPRQYLNDPEEAQRLAMEGHQSDMWSAMPGIVQSVDLSKMTCVVQLAIQGRMENPDGSITYVNIAPIQDVPICFPSAGGFTIGLPIAAGDEVLVVFAARCIDAWWQNGGYQNKPMEFRMHDLSDGFAIPGPRSQPRKVQGLSGTNLQIVSDSGTVFLSITPAGLVTVPGNLVVEGNITANNVTATTEVTAGPLATKLTTHKHTGGTLTGGLTGVPTP